MAGKKVLLVDDEPDQLAIRSLLITQQGLTSLVADSLEAALQLASDEKPACVVMDLRLPTVQSGVRLIRELKKVDPGAKIVVLTGRRVSKLVAPELDLVEAVFEKGSSAKDLLATITELCR